MVLWSVAVFFSLIFLLSVTSGIPLQLDRLLLVVLFDHISRRPVRSHLWFWPVPYQMGSYCQGKSYWLLNGVQWWCDVVGLLDLICITLQEDYISENDLRYC